MYNHPVYRVNLIVMNITWAACAFSYYMVGFYVKYIPGDIYTNVIIAQISDVSSSFIGGYIANRIGSKQTLILSFATASVFGLAMNYVNPSNTMLTLICLLFAKFGCSSAFTLVYNITAEYFPVKYASSIFGACNVVSRITAAFAPMIAEAAPPIPMTIFASLCFASMLATLKLKKVDDKKMASK